MKSGFFSQRGASRDLPIKLGMIALLACSMGVSSGGAADTATTDDKHPATPAADDGFTRESMAELGRPAPTPVPKGGIAASTRRKHAEIDSKDFVAVHYPVRHHRVAREKPEKPQITVVKHKPHRNAVVSFVYWWNGLVIRRLHTKVGTVMLGTIGAQS